METKKLYSLSAFLLLALTIAMIFTVTYVIAQQYRLRIKVITLTNRTLTKDITIRVLRTVNLTEELVKEVNESLNEEYVMDLPPGDYELSIFYKGVEVYRAPMEFYNDTTLEARINVTDAILKFYDLRGEPVKNGTLELALKGTNFTLSDEIRKGEVELKDIPVGSYIIRVYVHGMKISEISVQVNATATNSAALTLNLSDVVMVCENIRGRPLSSGLVKVVKGNRTVLIKNISSGGTAVLEDLPLGEYEIAVMVRNVTVYTKDIIVNRPEVSLIVCCNVTDIRLKVKDVNGKEVYCSRIDIIGTKGLNVKLSVPHVVETTVSNLPLGVYRIVAYRGDVVFYDKEAEITKGISQLNITCPIYRLSIQTSGDIRIRNIILVDVIENRTMLLTDFSKVDLYPGRYLFVVNMDDVDEVYQVTVKSNTTLRILPKRVTLSVIVVNTQGNPIKGVNVTLVREGTVMFQGITDEHGKVVIDSLKVGNYKIILYLRGEQVFTKDLEVTKDIQLLVEVNERIHQRKMINVSIALTITAISILLIMIRSKVLKVTKG